ncbi:MAG TPA: hypothetical protein VKV02_06465 [Acidobacteriaceae bacterium]|nr:hypothetical protein [Acidobacteriaceae bacterium]
MNHRHHPHPRNRSLAGVLALTLATAFGTAALAQEQLPRDPRPGQEQYPVKVFHLVNAAQQTEANEIMVALRNMIAPADRLFLLSQTNDIVVAAPPAQLTLIESLLKELDRPKHTYRVTYTLAESDAGKRVGVQHFSMVVVTGQRVQLKQGDKIPVATGSYGKDKASQETQFTYLDVGVNLDTTLDQFANGLRLRSKVEQSSVSPVRQTIADVDEPIVQQSVLEGTSVIIPGKPLVLGGIDIVGSTRHVDVEIVAEPLP